MNSILFILKYGGVPVDINVYTEEHILGTIYPININGSYRFTLLMNEEEDWMVLRESDGKVPVVEDDLLRSIVKKMRNVWYNAA